MRYLKFKKEQLIVMYADTGTATSVINEAIEMCKKHDIFINLFYLDFLFGLDKDSDLNEKVSDYNNWEANKFKTK